MRKAGKKKTKKNIIMILHIVFCCARQGAHELMRKAGNMA
jgi:hypothetical protein